MKVKEGAAYLGEWSARRAEAERAGRLACQPCERASHGPHSPWVSERLSHWPGSGLSPSTGSIMAQCWLRDL